jgi:hypothetical protein
MTASVDHYVHDSDGNRVLLINIDEEKHNNKEVYFTHDSATFEYTIDNLTDTTVEGYITPITKHNDEDSNGWPKINFYLGSGETCHGSIEANILAFQTSMIVGIRRAIAHHSNENYIIKKPDNPMIRPILTFSVWDKDFYALNFRRPRRLQYITAAFSIAIAFLALIQIIILITLT